MARERSVIRFLCRQASAEQRIVRTRSALDCAARGLKKYVRPDAVRAEEAQLGRDISQRDAPAFAARTRKVAAIKGPRRRIARGDGLFDGLQHATNSAHCKRRERGWGSRVAPHT